LGPEQPERPEQLLVTPFCFLIQNFAEIGQSVDELWPNKRFSRWRPLHPEHDSVLAIYLYHLVGQRTGSLVQKNIAKIFATVILFNQS